MRAYLVDDIPEEKLTALAALLDARGLAASLPGLYWLPLPDALLTPGNAAPMSWRWNCWTAPSGWSCSCAPGAVCGATASAMPVRLSAIR